MTLLDLKKLQKACPPRGILAIVLPDGSYVALLKSAIVDLAKLPPRVRLRNLRVEDGRVCAEFRESGKLRLRLWDCPARGNYFGPRRDSGSQITTVQLAEVQLGLTPLENTGKVPS